MADEPDTLLSTRAAEKHQLDPIVYVSSLVALFPPDGKVLGPDSPVKDPPGAYYKSKAEAERLAREYQERGVPVVFASIFPAERESLELEPAAYFVKPFALNELESALETALEREHTPA